MDPFGGLLGPQPTGNPYTFANTTKPVWQSTRLAQPKASGQAMTAPPRTLGQMVQSKVAGAVAPVAGQRFANNLASLIDYSPVGAVTQGFQFGQDLRNSNVGGAIANGIGTALNVVPDGAMGGAALHAIIAPLWHGSPHAFEKFAMDKIGTGEGAQAYGHGLYFAENPEVAKSYMGSAQVPEATIATAALKAAGGDRDRAIAMLQSSVRPGIKLENSPALQAVEQLRQGYNGASLYQVKLNANPEDFLDWDAPLGQQPQAVKRMVDEYQYPAQTLRQGDNGFATLPSLGEQFYRRLAGIHDAPDAASQALKEAGAPGIRYLDQGSRGAGNGTRNYVVFDPSIIDITGRH